MSDELTIGEVAARSGLNVSAVRFYEERGLIASTRTSGNQRRYRREVLRRLAMIQAGQHVGLTLEELSDALSTLPAGQGPTKRDWARLSSAWREILVERIEVLEKLRAQLDTCVGCGCLSMRQCSLSNPKDRLGKTGAGPRLLLQGDSSERH